MKVTINRESITKILTLLLAGALLSSCPMPMSTDLLEKIKHRVEEHNQAPQPDISILVSGVAIPDGGSTDAFMGAVQGTPLDVGFMIMNSGGADLHLRESEPIVISGVNVDLFDISLPPSSMTVQPNQSTSFTIRFLLDSPGSKSAQITVYSDDPDENPYEMTVSNTALPEIDVLSGTTEVTSGSWTCTYETTLFGAYRDRGFTIKNLGKANLDLSAPVAISGDGADSYIVTSAPSTPILPGSSTSFTVRFKPKAPGACDATLSITSSDPDENPFTFMLSGSCELPLSQRFVAAGGLYDGEGSGISLVRKSDGTAWAWGPNATGQVGDGTTTQRNAPVQVVNVSAIASVAAGSASVAVRSDGTLWAWGYNGHGELGNGTWGGYSEQPAQVSGLSGVVAASAGMDHTLALKKDGTVWGFGSHSYDKLSLAALNDATSPVQLKDAGDSSGFLTGVTAVAAGGHHSVFLKADGTVWTLGYNYYGQLGDGTRSNHNSSVQVVDLSDPTGHLTKVVAIAVGLHNTIALKEDGTVWTWGLGNYGQLGDGESGSAHYRLVPWQVASLSNITSIACGRSHSLALRQDGTVWAWGFNLYGQVGDASTTDRLAPVQVPDLTGVAAIAAGNCHSIAVKNDGSVHAWGLNWNGSIGDNSTTHRKSPVQVSTLAPVAACDAGNVHATALKSDGTVWAWGCGGFVGDGTTQQRESATQVLCPDDASGYLTDIVSVSAGWDHNLVLRSDGRLFAWGANYYGQLGTYAYSPSWSAMEVAYLTPQATAYTAGNGLSLAVADDGSVWTWGFNGYGQLGIGGTEPYYNIIPAQVIDPGDPSGYLTGAADVAAGYYHAVAVLSNGTVRAWGYNQFGQIGDGTTADQYVPVAVSGLSGITDVVCGEWHNLALKSNGTLWAWGSNGWGQLGVEIGSSGLTAVQVAGITSVAAIAAGANHSAALKSDGTVWAWGRNTNGQLGTTGVSYSSTPLQVVGLSGIAAISAGGDSTVAVGSDGKMWAWGSNAYGQLGDTTTTDHTSPRLVLDPLYLW